MADTPIPQQKGLSDEELAKMQPVSQEYKWDNPEQYPEERQVNIQAKIGLSNQKENLKHLLKKNLVFFEKDKANADSKDEYAQDTCLRTFVNNLADAIIPIIKAQKVTINAPLATTDVIMSGVLNSADGNFTFVGAGTGTGTETADTLGTEGSSIDIS